MSLSEIGRHRGSAGRARAGLPSAGRPTRALRRHGRTAPAAHLHRPRARRRRRRGRARAEPARIRTTPRCCTTRVDCSGTTPTSRRSKLARVAPDSVVAAPGRWRGEREPGSAGRGDRASTGRCWRWRRSGRASISASAACCWRARRRATATRPREARSGGGVRAGAADRPDQRQRRLRTWRDAAQVRPARRGDRVLRSAR